MAGFAQLKTLKISNFKHDYLMLETCTFDKKNNIETVRRNGYSFSMAAKALNISESELNAYQRTYLSSSHIYEQWRTLDHPNGTPIIDQFDFDLITVERALLGDYSALELYVQQYDIGLDQLSSELVMLRETSDEYQQNLLAIQAIKNENWYILEHAIATYAIARNLDIKPLVDSAYDAIYTNFFGFRTEILKLKWTTDDVKSVLDPLEYINVARCEALGAELIERLGVEPETAVKDAIKRLEMKRKKRVNR